MRKSTVVVELTVAVFTVLVAGAFTHAAVREEPLPLFRAIEQEADELGRKLFQGKGNCWTCHGKEGAGTVLGPSLADTVWLNSDGSLEAIAGTVRTGIPKPKQFPGLMPAMGGAKLSDKEIEAVAAFVYELSHTPPPAAPR